MHQLYPHLRTADSVVLAAPVYSMGMPALPKAMVDRCQPFWALKYVLKRNSGRNRAVPSGRARSCLARAPPSPTCSTGPGRWCATYGTCWK